MNFNQSRQAITPGSLWRTSILFLLIFFFAFANSNAQIIEPVKWTSKIEKKTETNFVLIFDGKNEDPRHGRVPTVSPGIRYRRDLGRSVSKNR